MSFRQLYSSSGYILKCEICQEFCSDTAPDWFVSTPCGHIFHQTHIRRWINENVGSRCPICKKFVNFQDVTQLTGYDPSKRKLNVQVAVLGDAGVGKTCLVKRFVTGVPNLNSLSTPSFDIHVRALEVDYENVDLLLWDPSGQERFHDIIPQCLRKSHGVLFCYDPMHYKSLVNVYNIWKGMASRYVQNENYVSVLVECKNDMHTCTCRVKSDFCRPVTNNEKEIVINFMGTEVFTTSTKNSDENALEAPFRYIVSQILKREPLMESILQSSADKTITLNDNDKANKKCCC